MRRHCAEMLYAVIDSDALWSLCTEQSALLKLQRPHVLVCGGVAQGKAHSAVQVSRCMQKLQDSAGNTRMHTQAYMHAQTKSHR